MPSVHRVLHGLRIAVHYGLDCEHTHSAWHPDFEFLQEDDCLLCQRDSEAPLQFLSNAESAPNVERTAAVSENEAPNHFFLHHSIRAPPTPLVEAHLSYKFHSCCWDGRALTKA